MFLLDTNILLEILLNQEKKEECKKFMNGNENDILISDFSLHSIGVILFRAKKTDLFKTFVEDIMEHDILVSLNRDLYRDLSAIMHRYGTDFDDSYQYLLAKSKGLTIVTLDKDFHKFADVEVISP